MVNAFFLLRPARNPAMGCILAASLLSACIGDSNSKDVNVSGWYGRISNSCGPTDGPAVMIELDSAAFRGCGAANPGAHAFLAPDYQLGLLTPGLTLSSQERSCDNAGHCVDQNTLSFTVDSSDSTQVRGTFRIEEPGKPAMTGKVDLQVCRAAILCG